MLLSRLQPPLRAAIASIGFSGPSKNPPSLLNEAFAQLSLCCSFPTSFVSVRYASHKAQGAVNKAKDGPGKRLGAKKSGGLSFHPVLYLPLSTIRRDLFCYPQA
jgi:large subunit ribosomal protein L27